MSFSRAKSAEWVDGFETITATQLNTIDTNIAAAVDGVGGATLTGGVTITGDLTIVDGSFQRSGAAATELVVNPSRWGYISEITAFPDFGGTRVAPGPDVKGYIFQYAVNEATQSKIGYLVRLPHNSVLDGVKAWIAPYPTLADFVVANRAGLPSGMPNLEVGLFNQATGVGSILGTVTDTSATVAAYETPKALAVTGLATTMDGDSDLLSIRIGGEYGTNNQMGFVITRVLVRLTAAELDWRGCVR